MHSDFSGCPVLKIVPSYKCKHVNVNAVWPEITGCNHANYFYCKVKEQSTVISFASMQVYPLTKLRLDALRIRMFVVNAVGLLLKEFMLTV